MSTGRMRLGDSEFTPPQGPVALARRQVGQVLPQPLRLWARRLLRRDRWPLAEHELRYNLNQIQAFEAVLSRHDLSLRNFTSILDFACGPGRLTQYLPWLTPQAQIFGCDVDADTIAECQLKCTSGSFYTNAFTPPLIYEDEQFDLIWSYSIFTSLPELTHQIWLKELARTLRPGGVMLHTTHSYEYLKRTATFAPERLVKYQFPKPVGEFIKSGPDYYYIADQPPTPEYGQALISKHYVTTKWPDITGLTVADYVTGAIESYPEGCQDIVMLVKESDSSPA